MQERVGFAGLWRERCLAGLVAQGRLVFRVILDDLRDLGFQRRKNLSALRFAPGIGIHLP